MSFSALERRLRIGSSRPVLSCTGPDLKKLKREERAEAGEMMGCLRTLAPTFRGVKFSSQHPRQVAHRNSSFGGTLMPSGLCSHHYKHMVHISHPPNPDLKGSSRRDNNSTQAERLLTFGKSQNSPSHTPSPHPRSRPLLV